MRRSLLIERLSEAGRQPILSVVGPPGYGKTTLLSQWAERNGQSFAWVSIDERDNEPKVLLRYVAEALDAITPIPDRVFEALASPRSSVPGSVVPRLGSALASIPSPVVLVLDDVHLLHSRESRAALSVLADHVPRGSRLALAGRTVPPLRIARLRAEGRLMEIGPKELALTVEEASSLLRSADLVLDEHDVEQLHRRTEGWPVGLYLAALYLREGGSIESASAFGGSDRLVSDYMESEFLSRITRRQRIFLTRTAVLDRMCGALCDAVLGGSGSAMVLANLERSNTLLVPLDRTGEWYRYHHLFRDMLLGELRRGEPDLISDLQRRASGWCLENGLPEASVEYSIAAEDVDATARLVAMLAVPAYREGRITTAERWIRWLDDRGGVDGHPLIAVLASILATMSGQPVVAERWADAVDQWHNERARREDHSAEAWAALLEAMLCRRGVEQMRAHADAAIRAFGDVGFVTPTPLIMRGIADLLSGDLESAQEALEDAIRIAEEVSSPEDLAVALCERSLVAMTRGDWHGVETLAERARTALRRDGYEESLATPLVCAVLARAALHRSDSEAAHKELVGAQRLRSELTYAVPYLAVQARLELIRVHIALADVAGARTLMREVDEILRRRPHLGGLVGEADTLRTRLSEDRTSISRGASTLTGAELRLLPLLPTHLSFQEIGDQMYLSPHTIKSQAISMYRKLGVSSRSHAVARSRELGLLDQ